MEFVTAFAFLVSKSEVHLPTCCQHWLQALSVDTQAVADNKLLPLTLHRVKEGVWVCSTCGRQQVTVVSMCVLSHHFFFFPERPFPLCHRLTALLLLDILWRIKKDSACNQHKVSREISLVYAILTSYWHIEKQGWWGKAEICPKLMLVSTGTNCCWCGKGKWSKEGVVWPVS